MGKLELRFDHPSCPEIAHIVDVSDPNFTPEIALIVNARIDGAYNDQLRYKYAHQFAASPDLLKALKNLVAEVEGIFGDDFKKLDEARSAIAKAEVE